MKPQTSVNDFKRLLHGRDAQIGLWLALADPYSAELCAGGGFDFLVLDAEHSPLDLRTMLAQLQSIASYPSHPVVRVPVGDPVVIKQVLDIGAQTLLVPMVDTEEHARHIVAATRYAPEGIRGVGAAIARAARWGADADYLRQANREIALILQVETVEGMKNLPAIAGLDGVDAVFLGAADLSASMGYLGEPNHPEVRKAMEQGIVTILSKNKAPGVLATDRDQAAHWLDLGARFVAVGVDALLLMHAARELAASFKRGSGGVIAGY